ncbi:transposase [Chamaesiphon sp. VAR_48_metabat_403]|uniref:IS110 family transposase n=1 Tax=Chamaesiphon sp. VAR_48_metabat_403 TaxID=2964700 RepID=UPI00286DB6AB|nr:transposase [Chamaesiphon sp. VAR_48_metabat_403]
MKIIGADACKDRLVYCVLNSENMPLNLREYYLDGANFHEAYLSAAGLKQILDLQPDVLALEPTGVNYTRLWVRKMSEHGVKVALIGHTQLKSYRKNLQLPDKDDPADALAIGAYYAEHYQSPQLFVLLRDETTAQLRHISLRLSHLARLQSPAINRLKQDLAYAFPERANVSSNAVLFWRWLGGRAKSIRYDAELAGSIGLGLSAEIILEASLLAQIQAEECRIEFELRSLLDDSQFLPYRKVLKKYGFGERAQATIISQIYPLENFLDEFKQPIVLTTKGKKSGTMTAKHISLRKVSKMLGVAPTREQSGKSKDVTKKAGSQLCRNAFWLWLFTRIEPERSRLQNQQGQEIVKIFTEYKAAKPIKLARAKTIGKVVSRLFYDLVDALNE